MKYKIVGREPERWGLPWQCTLLGVVSLAAATACGSTPAEQGTESAQPATFEPRDELAPRLEIARERVVRAAPAWKRATQDEVDAFLSRKNGGNVAPQPTAAELDELVAEATATDPVRRREGLRRLHDTMRSLPQAELRRDVGERMRATQLANLADVTRTREGSAR